MVVGAKAFWALLCVLAVAAASQDRPRSGEAAKSAVVVRVSAPLSVREGQGEASFRAHLAGNAWRFALAWSSERGHVRIGAAIATQPES